jgi:hypothetical protein
MCQLPETIVRATTVGMLEVDLSLFVQHLTSFRNVGTVNRALSGRPRGSVPPKKPRVGKSTVERCLIRSREGPFGMPFLRRVVPFSSCLFETAVYLFLVIVSVIPMHNERCWSRRHSATYKTIVRPNFTDVEQSLRRRTDTILGEPSVSGFVVPQ